MIKYFTIFLSTSVLSIYSMAEPIENSNNKLIEPDSQFATNTHATGFHLEKGSQFSLCRDYLANMNRVAPDTGLYCGVASWFDDIGKAAGLKQIPWVEVDNEDYKEALNNLASFRNNTI